ncbi:unnamed protein product [Closterium sp. Yama58-4]|nr:unnamed protein product [Closterium sp. Yama58-4]
MSVTDLLCDVSFQVYVGVHVLALLTLLFIPASPRLLLLALLSYALRMLGITAGYHRLLSHRYHYVPPLSLAALLLATGGVAAFGWGFCVATVVCWHFTYCINSLAHLVGSRRFRCEFNTHCDARNNLALALATLGEGWHNNHHCYMRSAKHGFYPQEIDITWYILCCLQRLGLVWDLHLPPLDELEARWFDNRHLQCRCHSAEKDMHDTISSSTLLAADMCAGTDVLLGGTHGKTTADGHSSRPCSHGEEDQGQAWYGMAGQAWYGMAGQAWYGMAGQAWYGMAGQAWYGMAGQAWYGMAGQAWYGMAGQAWYGMAGQAWYGMAGQAWYGMAGQAWYGMAGQAWYGMAGQARHGMAWQDRHGMAWQDRHGMAWQDRHGMAWQDRHGMAWQDRHGMAWQDRHGMVWQDRHGMAWQDRHGMAWQDRHGMAGM